MDPKCFDQGVAAAPDGWRDENGSTQSPTELPPGVIRRLLRGTERIHPRARATRL